MRVNHTGICVSDMERSVAFYEGILGLELIVDLEVEGSRELDAVVGMDEAKGRVAWLAAGDTVIELAVVPASGARSARRPWSLRPGPHAFRTPGGRCR